MCTEQLRVGNSCAATPRATFHTHLSTRGTQRGFSLVEAVLFIVVVSVALVVVLKAFEIANVGSADPVLRRQSLAIAQAMLEEIGYKPVADPGGGTPANRSEFDHVDDYNGFGMAGISTLDGMPLAGLEHYRVDVAVVPAAFGGVPPAAGRRFTVTVTDPSGQGLSLDGYKADY
jgi:MSHA pilin protein MshD